MLNALRAHVTRETLRLGRMLGLCVVVGLVTGLGAVGFFYMLEFGKYLMLDRLAGYVPATPGHEDPLFSQPVTVGGAASSIIGWVLFLLPALGGIVSGWVVFTFAPEAEGHGTDAAIESYHFRGGHVRARVPLIKAIASTLTIGSGGSAGREGPISQIGSGFGSLIGRVLGLPPHERRTLLAAGMGAGIGSIFHAPFAGALFAAEVMYRELDIEHEILVPAFITTTVAYAIFGTFFGFHPLFITPSYEFTHASMLLPFLILAGVCAGGAYVFVRMFYGVRRIFFGWLRLPNHIKPAIGGLVVGAIGYFLPEALATGYGVVQMTFNNMLPDSISYDGFAGLLPGGLENGAVTGLFLAVIALAKMATTSFTMGSGGSGGTFGPAIVIGGALGGATGFACRWAFPGMNVEPGTFALVGMAGFFAAAANTPISSIIIVSELTGNYKLLVPSMLVCILAYLLCRRVTLYEKQLPSHLEAPSQLGNMASAVLSQINVQQAVAGKAADSLVVVPQDMGFTALLSRFAQTTQGCLPVVDADGRLTGVIDTRDLRRVIGEIGLENVVIARDIEGPAVALKPSDSLLTAILRMVQHRSDELVVVDENDARKVVGVLSRSDIVATYDRQMIEAMT